MVAVSSTEVEVMCVHLIFYFKKWFETVYVERMFFYVMFELCLVLC